MKQVGSAFVAVLMLAAAGLSHAAAAAEIGRPGTELIASKFGFATLWSRLDQAIVGNGLVIQAEFSVSKNAAARGVTIPGNALVLAFRDDYALRLLQADVSAGIEMPLRFYITENPDGTASLSYRRPSVVLAPYLNKDLDTMAAALDDILAKIAKQATGT